jgi:hypothetical protein
MTSNIYQSLLNSLINAQTKVSRDLNYTTIKDQVNIIQTVTPLVIRELVPPPSNPTQPIIVQNFQISVENPNAGIPGSMKFNPETGQLEITRGAGFIDVSPVKQDLVNDNKLIAPKPELVIGDPRDDVPIPSDAETNVTVIATKQNAMSLKSKDPMDVLLQTTSSGEVGFKINNSQKDLSIKNKNGNFEIRDEAFARAVLTVKTKKNPLDDDDLEQVQMDNIASLSGDGVNLENVIIKDKQVNFGTDDGINIILKDDGINQFTLGTSLNSIDYSVPTVNDMHIFKINNFDKLKIKNECVEFITPICTNDIEERIPGDGVTIENVLFKNGQIELVGPTLANQAATKGYVDILSLGLDWIKSVIDRDLIQPPASSSIGDRYLIYNTGINEWVGRKDEIAEWNGTIWNFISPTLGNALLVKDEGVAFVYNGSEWVQFTGILNHNVGINLQGGNATDDEYYHLNEEDYNALSDVSAQLSSLHIDGSPTFNSINTNAINRLGSNLSIDGVIFGNNNIISSNSITSNLLKSDTIVSKTTNNGVSISGINMKNNNITGAFNVFTNKLLTDTIAEKTLTNGVDIAGVKIKDGRIIMSLPPLRNDQVVNKGYVDSISVGLNYVEKVISDQLNIPPPNPLVGNRYIVGLDARLKWFGRDNQIATWDGSEWQFTSVTRNMASYVDSANVVKVYNGSSWVAFSSITSHNTLSNIQGGTTDEYFHLTKAQHDNLIKLTEQSLELDPDGTPQFEGLLVNSINEKSIGNGVFIENVKFTNGNMISDNAQIDVITEKYFNEGVTIENILLRNNVLSSDTIETDTIIEKTADNGVTIENVLLKDNIVSSNTLKSNIIEQKTFDAGVFVENVLFKNSNISNLNQITAGNLRLNNNNIIATSGNINLLTSGSGTVNVTGNSILNNNLDVIGNAQFMGTVSFSNLSGLGLEVDGDAQINGNLTVNGSVTTIESSVIEIKDNIIVVNSGPSGNKRWWFSSW